MKKSILIPLLIFSTIQFTTAQKINQITYKLKSVDSLYVITDKVFSDEIIQTKSDIIFSKNIPNKNIISIEDNLNRRFDRVNFNHTNYYSKLLNEGYFNLYELKVNDKPTYIIYSKNDSVILEKNDTIIDQTIIKDRKYNNKLVFLCKDYPELLKVAEKMNFKNEDLQSLISALNEKHGGSNIKKPVISKLDYLSFSLKGMLQKNETEIMLGVFMSQYFLNMSTNLSVKYGIVASYSQYIGYFPDVFTGWSFNGSEKEFEAFVKYINTNKSYYETITQKYLEIPLIFNYEITNSTITPYFYMGLAPMIFSDDLTRSYSNVVSKTRRIGMNFFGAGGVKLKLTNSFNILSEYRYETLKGLNLKVGMEYFLKL